MTTTPPTPQAQTFVLDDRHVPFWREEFCDRLISADAPWSAGSSLDARIDVTQVDSVVVLEADMRKNGPIVSRSRERIASEGGARDALGLTLVRRGRSLMRVNGRERELRAGDVCLLGSAEPFWKTMGAGYDELFLYCPRAFVEAALGRPMPEQHGLVAPPIGLGRLLADTLEALHRTRKDLRAGQWRPLLTAVLGLTGGVFGGEPIEVTRPSARALQHDRALRYLEAHLDEPDLDAGRIASALGMSVRYLHRLFEAGPSLGQTMLGLRLERCRGDLATARRQRRSVSEIAFARGFNDAAHFSRAFKARFGMSPRDARET